MGNKMNKLLIIAILAFSTTVSAGIRCTTDYYGNQTCTGTGDNYGYKSQGTTDYYGNQNWTDNQGNRTTCSTDYYGNYTCN